MTVTSISNRIAELTGRRVPFVHATVVRAQGPSSAHPGDQAIVLEDGSIEGFVGGHCASGSVRTAALGALQGGESVLLRVLPDGSASFPESSGAQIVVNPCLSGGALEIFLEPLLPSPLLHLTGSTPTAHAIADVAAMLGFEVERTDDPARPGTLAAIVSSHGGAESATIRQALDVGVAFIGLVASKQRGEAVLDELTLTDDERARIRTPVGIAIGARSAPEIALSVMAQVVQAIRTEGLAVGATVAEPVTTIDPVCGMTVTIGPDTAHATVEGQDYWFCNPGCRDRFLQDR